MHFGDLRRTTPISRAFGMDRGLPIDRYYIERFLSAHAQDICGRVLEIADNAYTRRFGGARVTRSDVLHAVAGNPAATFVGDLANGDNLPSEAFDCIICTQTLMFIHDVRAAIATLHRMLRPGGVLLVSVAGISQICRWDAEQWGDHWRFTAQSLQQLAETVFDPDHVLVQPHGNVLAAAAFLFGLAAEDLQPRELEAGDRDYQLVITMRAQRS